MACRRCGGDGWVCEDHREVPFPHHGCWAAGAPCQDCQPANGKPRVEFDEPWWWRESKAFVIGTWLVWFSTAWPFVHAQRGKLKARQPRDFRICPKCGAATQWRAVDTGWENDCECGYLWWRPSDS